MRGLLAKFDSSMHTKSACSCALSMIIECKYPKKGSSFNNVLNDSSRAERFIKAAIACCDVFAVYCQVLIHGEQYISVSSENFEHSSSFPVIRFPDINVRISGLRIREQVFECQLSNNRILVFKKTYQLRNT